jgi:ammonia channel protein AmtB
MHGIHQLLALWPQAASAAPLLSSAQLTDQLCPPPPQLGTIALWIFWPSFTGALASQAGLDGATNPRQFYCIMNTLLSMLGSAVATFAVSALVEGKFDMVGGRASAVLAGALCRLVPPAHSVPGAAWLHACCLVVCVGRAALHTVLYGGTSACSGGQVTLGPL